MATPTTADIKAILDAGVYPDKTISPENIFDFPRVRKRYPSIEIQMTKPEGKLETKERTEQSYSFQITVLTKQVGLGSDEVVSERAIEDEIVILLNAATLGDHKVVNESFEWARTYPDKSHPYFIHSVLTIFIRRMISSTSTPDGVLTYDTALSTGDNKPGSNYVYVNIYDVEFNEGYRSINEQVTTHPDGKGVPMRYRGAFTGRFIGHMHVKSPDFGSTDDKVNQLMTIQNNGEKAEVRFIYTQKDANTPPATITENVDIEIDDISRLYSHVDLVRYRILATLIRPSTITAV